MLRDNQATDTVAPRSTARAEGARERMNIVVIGHVDHGKSSLVGRLLADTGSLPQGKLESVREQCRRNARPFEYAFLLDALKDEQAQGITIDSARCFFKSTRRDYIIIDAPGHIEFLKNMISGADRAEAGLLVIDAKEGVRENSRRHGYLMSLLGIRQIGVCVNKMDLVAYRQDTFEAIQREYTAFLAQVGIEPAGFIPISATQGANLSTRGAEMPWYEGPTVLEMVDGFDKEPPPVDKPLRFPVQDIYKFTEKGDDRRIVAGRIETGSVAVGEEVVFYPSGKRSTVASIEGFHSPVRRQAEPGMSIGVTLTTQIYVRPGEILCRANELSPSVTSKLRVAIFWVGRQPMIQGKRYKLKLGRAQVAAWLTEVHSVLDAGSLTTDTTKAQVERHEVAECVLETLKPLACDLAADLPQTGRFVVIDNYEIAGGGIVLDVERATQTLAQRHVQSREKAWDRSRLTPAIRASRYNQRSTLVLITGPVTVDASGLAKRLEESLFLGGRQVYYLGISNSLLGVASDLGLGRSEAAVSREERDECIRRLGETSHLFTDAGLILITAVSDLDDFELDVIETLNKPGELLVVGIGEGLLSKRAPDLQLDSVDDTGRAVRQIQVLLQERNYLPEYYL